MSASALETAPDTKKWRDVLKIHPACNLLPIMTVEELRDLADDIKANGLKHPVTLTVGEDNAEYLVDGRNRLDALELLGVNLFDSDGRLSRSFETADGLRIPCLWDNRVYEYGDITAYVISTNIKRRHLTQEQKRELIAKLLKEKPGQSDRQVAKMVQVDHKTVAAVRQSKEARGEIPHVSARTDTLGRRQSATKPAAKVASKPAPIPNTPPPPAPKAPVGSYDRGGEALNEQAENAERYRQHQLGDADLLNRLRRVLREWMIVNPSTPTDTICNTLHTLCGDVLDGTFLEERTGTPR